MKLKIYLPVIALVVGHLTMAQLFGPTFKANYLSAPELHLDAEKIAILKFVDENDTNWSYWKSTTDGGAKMSDYIVTRLLDDKRGLGDEDKLYISGLKTDIYTLVERSQLDKVLKEQQLGASGAIDDASAAEVGKLLGIDAIVSGYVSHTATLDRDRSSSKDKEGNVRYSYKIERVVIAESRIKVISVATGEILGNKEFTSTRRDSRSSSKGYPDASDIKSEEQLKNDAYKGMARQVANYFSPGYNFTGRKIMKVKTKEYKKAAKEAVDYLKDERIDKALAKYQELYELDPYNAEIAYNTGIMYEGTGNYDKALTALAAAAEINPDKDLYKNANKRVANIQKYTNFLKTKGIEIKPYEFATSGSKLADRVTTKGKTKDRYDVFEQMDSSSKVVAKVPGGTDFDIIEDNDVWIKIKLLGGKEGYILSSSVKR
ncbi:MAG: tetratricopeptide repeat protein [Cyclobacteriaceae bacterium]|nr:tetratricopeptide repeat protein [Cyclobacteriaceae bacterium HetDA_MAG_MS6]